MSGTIGYSVEVEFLQKGNLNSGLSSSTAKAAELGKNIGDAGGKVRGLFSAMESGFGGVSSVIDSVAGKVFSLGASAVTAATGAMVGGFAMAVREAVHFKQEMENTQISMAAIANSTGSVASLGGGMRVAGDVLKQMRVDARELPGTFEELRNILALISPAMSNAGVGMPGAEAAAAKLMTSAKLLNVSIPTAGREFGMMLAGNARHSMPLFTKLGFTDTKAFNAMSQEKRLEAMRMKMDELNKAAGLIKNTWETTWSTAVDKVRSAVGLVGGPLVERIKDVLTKFNEIGGDRHFSRLQHLGEALSQGLVDAWDKGSAYLEKAVTTWYPHVATFLGTMERGFVRVFGLFGPAIGTAFEHVQKFMDDPAAFNKLAHLATTMLALRVGSAAGGIGASLAGAAAPALAAGGGEGFFALAAAAAPAALAVGVLALATYGAVDVLVNSSNRYHEAAMASAAATTASAARASAGLAALWVAVLPLVDMLGMGLLYVVQGLVNTFADLVGVVKAFADATLNAQSWINETIFGKGKLNNPESAYEETKYNYPGFTKTFDAPAEPERAKVINHVTNIHGAKIEIKVQSNQDPNRIAKETKRVFQEWARNPKSGQGNPNPGLTPDLGF